MEGLTGRLGQHIAQVSYDEIPHEIRELTKLGILDSYAAAVAGSLSPIARKVAAQTMAWGGREESTVWVYGGKLPAPQAALLNGMLVHSLDMDAVHDDAIVHGFTSVVPAAIAVAEEVGASGRDLIAAVAVGTDFAVRMGLASGFYHGFILTATLGGFGAAAASSRVLGLDSRQTLNALGIYYSQAAGNRQAFADAASTTRYQPGFSARNGALSAYFARRGLSGARHALEGRFGYFNLYFEGTEPNIEALLADLGQRYESANISFKPYPSCRGTHAPVEATLKIMTQNGIRPEQVDEILVRTPTSSLFTLIGRPFEVKPDAHVDAQYSIPYAVATAVLRGGFFVRDLYLKAIVDPVVLKMAARVKVFPEFEVANRNALTPVEVEIRLLDGQRHSLKLDFSKGHPRDPMTHDDLTEKFRRTVREIGTPEAAPIAERIIELVDVLENLPDIRELGGLLGKVRTDSSSFGSDD